MGKYKALVETIANDYIGRLYRSNLYEEDNNTVENEFDISSNVEVINNRSVIVEYSISEKNINREWDIIVCPVMLLFANHMKKYRIEILKKRHIAGIFTVKNEAFKNSTIPIAVIVLDENIGETWLSSVASYDDILSLISSPQKYERNVYYTDDLDVENFMPEHYNGELERINKILDVHTTVKLGDIADVIIGKNVSSRELGDSGIPYLRIRDIQNGHVGKTDLYVPNRLLDECSKQLLQEGDILLSKNYGQYKIAKVEIDDLPAIASNNLFIIRAYGVPEGYLYQYLTSKTGKALFEKQLSSIEKGTVVQSVNLKDLVGLKVPIFDELTMKMFSSADSLNSKDIIQSLSTITRLLPYVKFFSGKKNGISLGDELDKSVLNSFLESGWSEKEILFEKGYTVTLPDDTKWRPDIVLLNGEQKLAVVDIKMHFSQFTEDKIKTLNYVVQEGDIPFVILSTGDYFEIHSKKNRVIKKMTEPPTKELLLSLLDEKEEK